ARAVFGLRMPADDGPVAGAAGAGDEADGRRRRQCADLPPVRRVPQQGGDLRDREEDGGSRGVRPLSRQEACLTKSMPWRKCHFDAEVTAVSATSMDRRG